jgi:HPt (histidine-containing phosphotransfer) domain-containing protein
MDWDNDPELKKMRDEFIDSFRSRHDEIRKLRYADEIARHAHRLAGAAESYGFPHLGDAAAKLEDWIGSENYDPSRLEKYRIIYEHALEEAARTRRDLTSFGGYPGAAPKS